MVDSGAGFRWARKQAMTVNRPDPRSLPSEGYTDEQTRRELMASFSAAGARTAATGCPLGG